MSETIAFTGKSVKLLKGHYTSLGDPDRSFRLETYGAERIEVPRGPASVLYGSGGPGGIVNYISKQPLSKPLYEVELAAGSFDRYEGKLDLSGPIDEAGVFPYRLSGLRRDSDTQVDFIEDDRFFIAPAIGIF